MHMTGDNEKLQKFAAEIKEFEGAIIAKHRRQMQEELRAYLEQKDHEAAIQLQGQGGFASRGVVQQTILTSVGNVRVRVHRYRNRSGRECYPLRDLYGLHSITPRARQLCVHMATERSYGWSATTLQEVCGMEISRMRLWQVIQEEGTEAMAQIEAERRAIFEHAHERPCNADRRPAVIEVDGTMLASRDERASLDEYGRKRMEVKLGVVFRGVASSGSQRRVTCARSVYARVADVASFSEQFSAHCARQGVGADTPVHFLGDGARWLQTVRQAVFPRSRYTLDLYHLQHAAHRVMLPDQHRRFSSFVMTGLVHTAIDYVKHLRAVDAQHAQELDAFVNYLQENRHGMHYRRGDIHGSGVIEKMADLVVKKRMKRQGMRWSTNGANAILALRTQLLNAQQQPSVHTVHLN